MHDVYVWVKFLHHLAAAAWLGWMLLGPAWLGQGLIAHEAALLDRMRRSATRLTVLCIGAGGLFAGLTGWPMARTLSPDAFELRWLGTGTALSITVSVFWLAVLLPLYRKLLDARKNTGAHPRGLAFAWRWGCNGAAVMGVATLWMMAVRPA